MRTHISYAGFCVRWVWHAKSSEDVPHGAGFISFGRLVNPKGSYVDAPVVSLYYSPSAGYGYKD